LLLSYDALQPRRSPIKVVRSVTEPVSWISVALNAKTFHLFGKNIDACRNFIYLSFYAFFNKSYPIFWSKLVKNYWCVNYLVQFYVFLPLKLQIYYFYCHIYENLAVER